MQVVSIVGARPQFIKAAALSVALRKQCREFLVHTGQHYDDNMSDVFFEELEIPPPDRHLGVGSGTHGAQTGVMLERIERVLEEIRPDAVVVYGDTNSTLAGALAAAKLQIPVAHVEAGLRSFDRHMPEEINRILTDHVSRWLLAPSESAVAQLATEGITAGVYDVGDIMADSVRRFRQLSRRRSKILQRLGIQAGKYCVATVHRAANTAEANRLRGILQGLRGLPLPVIFPVHPRTKAALRRHRLDEQLGVILENPPGDRATKEVTAIDPVGYLDMLQLQQNAAAVLTDSGGMQKEAYYLGVPCITLREETEWVETVQVGWNFLAGVDPQQITVAFEQYQAHPPKERPVLYGDGHSAERIVRILSEGWDRDVAPSVESLLAERAA